ncbi:MAG: amino acid permease [Candidatus Babeliales bacterium]
MAETGKLSLRSATLININIMFGTGVFINTINLIKIAGFFGFVSYCLVALILLPLIIAITQLIQKYPEGGFYAYAAYELSPFWGFLSTWAYFIGKLASAALLIHVFSLLMQTIIFTLATINPFILDIFTLALFMWINHYGLKTSTRITYLFIFLKLVPIIFVILAGIYLFNHWTIPAQTLKWAAIPSTIPLVLYAFLGFEAACALSQTIENPQKNAVRAIFYSFIFTITITIIYQLIIFLVLGTLLFESNSFLDIFPSLFKTFIINNKVLVQHIINILHIAGASSALGGAYGMIFSNAWNLYILAEQKHIFFASLFRRKNQYGIPFFCVLFEGLVCIMYLLTTLGHQTTLQQISVLGVIIAFTLSIIALLRLSFNQGNYFPPIAWLGLGSCLILLTMSIRNFTVAKTEHLIFFLFYIVFGVIMYLFKNYKSKNI